MYYCLLSTTELSLCCWIWREEENKPTRRKGKKQGMTKCKVKLIINFGPKAGKASIQKGESD